MESNRRLCTWAAVGVSTTLPPPEVNPWSYLLGAATTVALFFIAWGLRDVKSRYDKVPALEAEIASLEGKIRRLCAELGKRYEDC